MSNISETLFSSDLVRMILTQVVIWRENWKRRFPAKYSLFPGDLSQCQRPDRWWTMHHGKTDLKLSRRFTTVFVLTDVFQLLHCNLENYASKEKRGLRFSVFCNVKIYWNLLILLNKMNLQCLILSCIIKSYELDIKIVKYLGDISWPLRRLQEIVCGHHLFILPPPSGIFSDLKFYSQIFPSLYEETS